MLACRHQSATALLPAAASFWPALLPAAASFWPSAQVFMLARRHRTSATLLPAAASFWPTLLPAAASFWPPAQVAFMPGCRHQPASFWPPAHARLLPPICSRSAWPHSDGALPRRYLRRPGARCQHQAIAPGPLPAAIYSMRCPLLRLGAPPPQQAPPHSSSGASRPHNLRLPCARAAARLLLCLETKGRRAWRSSAGQQCGPVSVHGWGAGGTGAPTGWRAASSHGPARPAGLWAPLVEA